MACNGPLGIFWLGYNAVSNLFKEVVLWSPGLVFDKFPTLDSGLKDVELQSSAQRPLAREPLSCHRNILEGPTFTGLPSIPWGGPDRPSLSLESTGFGLKHPCFPLFAFGIKTCKSTGGL